MYALLYTPNQANISKETLTFEKSLRKVPGIERFRFINIINSWSEQTEFKELVHAIIAATDMTLTQLEGAATKDNDTRINCILNNLNYQNSASYPSR